MDVFAAVITPRGKLAAGEHMMFKRDDQLTYPEVITLLMRRRFPVNHLKADVSRIRIDQGRKQGLTP